MKKQHREAKAKRSERDCSGEKVGKDETDEEHLGGAARLKKTKRYCCLVTRQLAREGGSIFFLHLSDTNTHQGPGERLCGHQGLSSP